MAPKHSSNVPEDRKAIAPYNFVQLPAKVIKAPPPPTQAKYERHTGYFICTLITESPLYIRCGHTPVEFEQGLESRQLPAFFYNPNNPQKPLLPGSSLRGMLRTLVEIVSFSRITQVSDAQKFFFRAVAATKGGDPLAEPYKRQLNKNNVKAGYLVKRGEQWLIRPAQPIDRYPFVWIREDIVTPSIREFIPMRRLNDYYPQQIFNVSFGEITQKNTRPFAQKISQNSQAYPYHGVLVSSGNMLESGQNARDLKRKNHCLIGQPDEQTDPLLISDEAVASYRSALTKFQKDYFDEDYGALVDGHCIFYCEPAVAQNGVTLFGHCPNFRIPYQIKGRVQASTAQDFIPQKLQDLKTFDLATALFGFVQSGKVDNEKLPPIKGRVSVTDAICETTENIWYEDQPIVPQILEAPKLSTFQHYLVQPEAERPNLKHYGSQPGTETIIRGHKLYWHKGKQPGIKHPKPQAIEGTAYETKITPIRAGVEFRFRVHFENLNDVELGALLWVLDLAKDDRYRLSLGMGKPLGMGTVKINHELYLGKRQQRYKKLFENDYWVLAESLDENTSLYTQAFEQFILKEIDPDQKFQKLEDVRRIKMLLAMLTWEEKPKPAFLEQTRYMEIERDAENKPFIGSKVKPTDKTVNEYRLRPVLPTPLQVRGWEESSNRPTKDRPKDISSKGAADPLRRGERVSPDKLNNSNVGKSAPIKKRKP